ncbi:hypothetical protein LSS_16021 [Leptospira santarosai serovar Shermani str. LT 821]|uniref:Uncharacterized protein n=1 Tax=Leptospira santarosai serovar Shermani str. LT 821 TaxID=758847 RepID=K8Y7K2_9LEPT|nr:hypothetical protein LSS_16021 [Leptospira santarosai serovar Shermani str. LT 821]
MFAKNLRKSSHIGQSLVQTPIGSFLKKGKLSQKYLRTIQ